MLKINADQKALAIGLVAGLLVSAVVIAVYAKKQRQEVTTELSNRSQEFIQEHRGDVGTAAVDFGDGQPFEQDLAVDGNCFSVVVPFASKRSTAEEPLESCTVRLTTQNPSTRLVISVRPFTSKMSEDPAIQLRRQASFGYRESSVSAKKYSDVIRFDDKETVSVFWLTAGKMMTVGFTGLTDTSKVDNDRLAELIDSIIVNTTPTKVKKYDATSSATVTPQIGI